MICPHCQKEIIVTLTSPADDVQHKWNKESFDLRYEWKKRLRAAHSDRANLAWLDGRYNLLKRIGITKQEALRLLKKEGNV